MSGNKRTKMIRNKKQGRQKVKRQERREIKRLKRQKIRMTGNEKTAAARKKSVLRLSCVQFTAILSEERSYWALFPETAAFANSVVTSFS